MTFLSSNCPDPSATCPAPPTKKKLVEIDVADYSLPVISNLPLGRMDELGG